MTPDSRVALLDNLAAGFPLHSSLRHAGITPRAYAAALDTDASLATDVAAAEAQAAERKTQEAPPVKADAEAPPRGVLQGLAERVRTWANAAQVSAEAQAQREADAEPADEPSEGPLSLAAITREAARLAPGDFGYFLWVNERRARFGLHRISPWWLYSIEGFYVSEKPVGVWCVGRGGGKSTTLETFSGERSLFVPRVIPPGQTWTWPFISVGPDDANRRVNGIAAVYRSIGLKIVGDFDPDATSGKVREGVEITRSPRASLTLQDARGNDIQLASIAGTIGNVSGPSTIGMTIDEASKLRDKSTNANPLTEILASGLQTSRGRAGWRAIVCSSAWEKDGAHWQLVEQGDNETNYVARIGAPFIDAALAGFDAVASWEERMGDAAAAKKIRAHAESLTAASPLVPTWVANPTLGNPAGEPWDGAALATRMLVQALPPKALDGLTRVDFWLRECGSLPLDKGAGGVDYAAQCRLAADITARLAAKRSGVEPRRRDVQPHPLAPPGDARYAGPQERERGPRPRRRAML